MRSLTYVKDFSNLCFMYFVQIYSVKRMQLLHIGNSLLSTSTYKESKERVSAVFRKSISRYKSIAAWIFPYNKFRHIFTKCSTMLYKISCPKETPCKRFSRCKHHIMFTLQKTCLYFNTYLTSYWNHPILWNVQASILNPCELQFSYFSRISRNFFQHATKHASR